MFKEGDRVVVIGTEDVLKVVKAGTNKTLVEFEDGERIWFNNTSLKKSQKREVEISIKVEVSDDAKYVAVDNTGEIYEYLGDCEECFAGFSSEKKAYRICVTNWRETKTKVVD